MLCKNNMKKRVFNDHISGCLLVGVMDNQRTEISDCVRMVVIHGTGRKIMKVEAYGFQF